ncbi:MAG: hypothetical protein HKN49_07505 [Gammaproteobacteria bacterium]|nr:hypothetical protein [Gammaproteobacteria bacterium]
MTNANMNQYKKRQQQISRESMHNVNESIDSIDRHILAAKVVRDSAATTLMIGSVVLSGGAAAAAIGGNAMVSGAKKYAETERIHDAVISAGTEIVFARVKFGKGVGGELLLAFAKSGVENGALWAANDFGDMAKGKTALYETVRDAAVDVAVGELLNTRLVRQGIVKAAFPLHKQMRVEMRQATGLLRGKSVTFGNGSAATKMLKSLPQAALKAGGKKAIDYSVSQITAKDATPVRQSIPYWENSRQAVGIRKLQ